MRKSCRTRKTLQNEYLVAKIGVDIEENGPSEVDSPRGWPRRTPAEKSRDGLSPAPANPGSRPEPCARAAGRFFSQLLRTRRLQCEFLLIGRRSAAFEIGCSFGVNVLARTRFTVHVVYF